MDRLRAGRDDRVELEGRPGLLERPARSLTRIGRSSFDSRLASGSVQRSLTVPSVASRPASERRVRAYRAVTAWPAPIAPALTPGSRNWPSGDGPVLVADEPVGRDDRRVELDLGLGVEGDRLEGPDEILREQAPGLGEVVDIGVEAVTLVRQLLEQDVVVVAHPDADRDELDPGGGIVADLAEDGVGVGQPDVGDAIRGEDDPIDPAVAEERLARQRIAEREAGLQVRRATGLELIDGPQDRGLVGRPGRRQDDARRVAEGDDRDRNCRTRANGRACAANP